MRFNDDVCGQDSKSPVWRLALTPMLTYFNPEEWGC